MSQTCILYPPLPDSRVYIDIEVNSSHLEFSPSSCALLVPFVLICTMALFVPLLEVWILEAQCGVNLREKSFAHIEKLMPGSEKLFITRSFSEVREVHCLFQVN